MTKILFLFPYPHATAASQRFRFEQYLDILKENGIGYDLQSFLDERTWEILYKPKHYFPKIWGIIKGFGRRLLVLFRLRKYDFVFIHRETTPIGPPIFEWLIAKVFKKKVIFDFDDAIWLSNTSKNNKIAAGIKFHGKTASVCRWAYKVSAGNDYLADYAAQFNKNVVVNPTTIDTQNWHNRIKNQREGEKIVIGWTGTHSTIKYLDEIIPIFEELEKDFSFEFLVISDREPDFKLNSLVYQKWNKETEIEDLLKMNIGIMPLTEDKWANGKCGFKALQYMALGIPALVSPVGVNTKIIDNQVNGYICETLEDWKKHLSFLVENLQLREQLGKEARKKIESSYSVVSNTPVFLGLFD